MSKNKNKGDILEMMIYILEKSITDNPTTIIKTNHRIPDQYGILREVDIYVESTVNGKVFKYAFECKNYKRGVELKHITDFNSRIVGTSVKGYLVTSSNYQKGAIDMARAVHIDLLRLKKKDVNDESIKGLIFSSKRFKIEKIRLIGDKIPAGINVEDILEQCSPCKRAVAQVAEEDIIPTINANLDNAIESIYPGFDDFRNVAKTASEKNAKQLSLIASFDEGAHIKHKGIIIPYAYMLLDLKVWHEVSEKKGENINSFSYIKHNDEGLLATFSMAEFYFDDHKIVAGITKIEGGRSTLSMSIGTNTKTISVERGICLGTIDELGLKALLDDEPPIEH